jgi:hypothetical protein
MFLLSGLAFVLPSQGSPASEREGADLLLNRLAIISGPNSYSLSTPALAGW